MSFRMTALQSGLQDASARGLSKASCIIIDSKMYATPIPVAIKQFTEPKILLENMNKTVLLNHALESLGSSLHSAR